MDEISKPDLQFFQSELKRVADWIQFSDKKSAFLATYYAAIFGVIISHKESILENISKLDGFGLWSYWASIATITTCTAYGLYHLSKSVFPSLKNSYTSHSLCYFGTIACMKFMDFSKTIEMATEDEFKKQIIEQIYTTSLIANQKMKSVQKATHGLIVLIILAVVFAFIFS